MSGDTIGEFFDALGGQVVDAKDTHGRDVGMATLGMPNGTVRVVLGVEPFPGVPISLAVEVPVEVVDAWADLLLDAALPAEVPVDP